MRTFSRSAIPGLMSTMRPCSASNTHSASNTRHALELNRISFISFISFFHFFLSFLSFISFFHFFLSQRFNVSHWRKNILSFPFFHQSISRLFAHIAFCLNFTSSRWSSLQSTTNDEFKPKSIPDIFFTTSISNPEGRRRFPRSSQSERRWSLSMCHLLSLFCWSVSLYILTLLRSILVSFKDTLYFIWYFVGLL